MDQQKEKIIELAQSNGYDYALYRGYWEDYEVYEPIFWDIRPLCIGWPTIILVKGDELKIINDEECFKITEEMEDYLSDSGVIENEPIKLEENLTIKSFKFERGGHFGNYQVFEYKSLKKGKFLSYDEEGKEEFQFFPGKVEITDENFDKFALEMISYFNKDFGINQEVRDGEWFEFKATLSDGQKLKSGGYNYFPYSYYRFIKYLEHYIENNEGNYTPSQVVSRE